MNWWVKSTKRFVQPNYIGPFLIIASAITACISISVFASLLGIPRGITSSAIGLKICARTAGVKNYKSIIKKKKHDKIVSFGNSWGNPYIPCVLLIIALRFTCGERKI